MITMGQLDQLVTLLRAGFSALLPILGGFYLHLEHTLIGRRPLTTGAETGHGPSKWAGPWRAPAAQPRGPLAPLEARQ